MRSENPCTDRIPTSLVQTPRTTLDKGHLSSVVILLFAIFFSIASIPELGMSAWVGEPVLNSCKPAPPFENDYTFNIVTFRNQGGILSDVQVQITYLFYTADPFEGTNECEALAAFAGFESLTTNSFGSVSHQSESFLWDDENDRLVVYVTAMKEGWTFVRKTQVVSHDNRGKSNWDFELKLSPEDDWTH